MERDAFLEFCENLDRSKFTNPETFNRLIGKKISGVRLKGGGALLLTFEDGSEHTISSYTVTIEPEGGSYTFSVLGIDGDHNLNGTIL